MKQYGFSDGELRTAAASVRASMLSAVEAIPSGKREFSEGFLAKMDELFVADKRRRKRRLAWRHVAGLFLACLIGVSVWLAVDENARAAFQRWWREVTENSVIYQFFGRPELTFPQYELTWIPEGYVLDSEIDDEYNGNKQRILTYENPETGESFSFCYQSISEDISMVVGGYENEDAPMTEHCSINGIDGEYYPPGAVGTSSLMWMDEKNGVALYIDSTFDKDTMLRIAEGAVVTYKKMAALPRYEMTWMPEEFSIVDEDTIDEDEIRFTYYINENDDLSFDYSWMFDGTSTFIFNPNGLPDAEECEINGLKGQYYPSGKDSRTNVLIWMDEEQGIVFSISSTLDKDTMLRIARNVVLVNVAQ